MLLIPALATRAEITLDGTLGSAGSLTGPDYRITADLGQQVGTNLFHSFGRFGLDTGESATFSGPDSVANVIGRVTGGEPSNIDGTIRSTIPGADLYLTNPSGILFGPNARLDLGGSFHAATAHHLRLEDGGRFDAVTPVASTLSAAPVAAFGFLDQAPEAITIDQSRLQVPQAEEITLVGGDVQISDATLYAPGGRIGVAAVGAGGTAVVGNGDLTIDGSGGEIEIRYDGGERPVLDGYTPGDLDVSAEGGGRIVIVGGRILMEGAQVYADSWGSEDAGGVVVEAQEAIELRDGATIASWSYGAGDAGSLEVTAGELSIDGAGSAFSTGIDTNAFSSGDAGSIEVEIATSGSFLAGGSITSNTHGTGNAGPVTVTAGRLSIDGAGSELVTGISSQSNSGATGDAGAVEVTVTDACSILSGGVIDSGAFGEGDANSVTVEVGSLSIDGTGSENFTGITSQADPGSSGDGGDIQVTIAAAGSISGGGRITSSSFGAGDAGSLTVTAASLSIDGAGSDYLTGIDSSTYSSGDGGDVELTLTGAGSIVAGGKITSSTSGTGEAGSVTVTAGSLWIDGADSQSVTGITNQASSGSTGNAGTIQVTIAETCSIASGGVIDSGTFSEGDGGTVKVTVGSLSIDGTGSELVTGITSQTDPGTTGDGGTIDVTVASAGSISAGGSITSSTSGTGSAGSVKVTAGSLSIDGAGSDFFTGVDCSTYSTGDGGDIELAIADAGSIAAGGRITSSTSGAGNAGPVTVTAGSLWIDGAESEYVTGITSQASPDSTGNAGTVQVTIAEACSIISGGVIDSGTFSEGSASSVKVTTGSLSIDGAGTEYFTGITSQADPGSTGDAGTVQVIVADSGSIVGGGVISSDTAGTGDAGVVKVTAGELSIDGQDDLASSISTSTVSTGDAGRIEIQAGRLVLSGSGMIASTSIDTGNAGDIESMIEEALQVQDGGTIFAGSILTTGGNIRITAPSTQVIRGGAISSSVFGSEESNGGNVTVDGGNLVLLEGGSITATATQGLGGYIQIDTTVFLHDADSLDQVLDASSGTAGNDGTVEVNAPDLDISGSLVALPGSFLDASGGLDRSCDATRAGRRSSLLVMGRSVLPQSPDAGCGATIQP